MVYDLFGSERHLRSKRELIEIFIEQHMPSRPQGESIEDALAGLRDEERTNAIAAICSKEGVDPQAFKGMIESHHFSGKKTLQGEVVESLIEKPKILERKSGVERIVKRLLGLVTTIDEGIGGM